MKRAKSILSAFVLTCALCSTAFAGNISGVRGNISGVKASGNISGVRAAGNISGANATGNISGMRGTGNISGARLFLAILLTRMPWFFNH